MSKVEATLNRKYIPNSFQIANAVVDELMRRMSPSAFMCYVVLCRKTTGWHKEEDAISASQFAELTGLSERVTKKAVNELVDIGLVLRRHGPRGIGIYQLQKIEKITGNERELLKANDCLNNATGNESSPVEGVTSVGALEALPAVASGDDDYGYFARSNESSPVTKTTATGAEKCPVPVTNRHTQNPVLNPIIQNPFADANASDAIATCANENLPAAIFENATGNQGARKSPDEILSEYWNSGADTKTLVWKLGVYVLSAELSEIAARKYLGRLIKDFGEQNLADALVVCLLQQPVQPTAYIQAVLRKRRTEIAIDWVPTDNQYKQLLAQGMPAELISDCVDVFVVWMRENHVVHSDWPELFAKWCQREHIKSHNVKLSERMRLAEQF